MQIGQRLDIGERRTHRRVHRFGIERRADQAVFRRSPSRIGKSVAAPTPMAMRLHFPSAPNSICAAAETNAKSLRRALTS